VFATNPVRAGAEVGLRIVALAPESSRDWDECEEPRESTWQMVEEGRQAFHGERVSPRSAQTQTPHFDRKEARARCGERSTVSVD